MWINQLCDLANTGSDWKSHEVWQRPDAFERRYYARCTAPVMRWAIEAVTLCYWVVVSISVLGRQGHVPL